MNRAVIIFSILAAIAAIILKIWTGSTIKQRITAVIALEFALTGLALAASVVAGNELMLDISIAWLVQAGAVIIVLTRAGNPA